MIHTLNPLADLARICAARGVLFHCDATQWVGKLPMDVDRLGHRRPEPLGAQVLRPEGRRRALPGPRALQAGIAPQILGGGQEDGLRSGTLNVPAIVGLGVACQLAIDRQETDAVRTDATRPQAASTD